MDGKSIRRIIGASVLLGLIIPVCGCMGLAAQLGWMIWGRYVDAEYEGLENKRVAVVCVSDASNFGPNPMTSTLGTHIGVYLSNNVDGIEIVRQAEIDNWKDNNNWQVTDYVEIGRGVKADRVIAIEIDSYSLMEGQTLYKGRANMRVSVYDIEKNGNIEYVKPQELYEFPKTHGRPIISSTERQFEATFLQIMAEDIAKHFYKHEIIDEYGGDARPIR